MLTVYRAPDGATVVRRSRDGVGGWRDAGVLDAEPMSTYAQMVAENDGSVAVAIEDVDTVVAADFTAGPR